MTTFDDRAAVRLRRTYSTEAVVAQRRRTIDRLHPRSGERLLDLGCGPGYLAVELAEAIGESGRVLAVDPSEAMLVIAREEVAARDLGGRVTVVQGTADALPVDDGALDGVVVVQVLEHVPDVAAALGEIHRALRPGGRLVVVDTDWRSCVWESDDRDRTERVVRAWQGRFAHPHLPGELPALLREAGFGEIAIDALPIVEVHTDVDTYSMGMLGTIAGYVGDDSRLGPDEAAAWRADVQARADRGDYLFCLTRFLVEARRQPSTDEGGDGSNGAPTSKTDSSSDKAS
jgi:arsenite methyltransferase